MMDDTETTAQWVREQDYLLGNLLAAGLACGTKLLCLVTSVIVAG